VDSRWPKTKDFPIQNKNQNPFRNQWLSRVLDFTQSSQQSVEITKFFHRTETSTHVPNSCCRKMSLVEFRQSLREKYVSFSWFRQATNDTDRWLHLIQPEEGIYSGQKSTIECDKECGNSGSWQLVILSLI
jgi:hypothetical protein